MSTKLQVLMVLGLAVSGAVGALHGRREIGLWLEVAADLSGLYIRVVPYMERI